MTRLPFLSFFLFAMLLCPLAVPSASGGSPWKWQSSLAVPEEYGRLLHPSSFFIDETRHRFYVSDTGNDRLLSFDFNGTFLNEFNPEKKLDMPGCLLRTDKEIFLVCEGDKAGLTLIDPKAKRIEHLSLRDQDREVIPRKIVAVDHSFLVLDRFSGDIILFDAAFHPSIVMSCSSCESGFIDFAVNEDKIFALQRESGNISVFSPEGNLLQTITLTPGLQLPYALAVDQTQRLFIIDRSANQIAVYTMDGKFAYAFLGKGNNQGKLYFPAGLQFDDAGRLIVLDEGNGRVEIYQR